MYNNVQCQLLRLLLWLLIILPVCVGGKDGRGQERPRNSCSSGIMATNHTELAGGLYLVHSKRSSIELVVFPLLFFVSSS